MFCNNKCSVSTIGVQVLFILLLMSFGPLASLTAAPVRIMPLGDSITGSPGCWRAILWNKLQASGFTDIDFVGSLSGQTCSLPFDNDGEGHGGILATGIASQNQLPPWLTAAMPDIVMMHLGTNDIFNTSIATETILAAYSTMVDQMRANNPDMKILVAKIIPVYTATSQCTICYQHVIDLNTAIDSWAAGKNSSRSPIIVVDQWTGFDTTTDTGDGIHPNDTGNRKIADKWYPALAALLSGTTPPPSGDLPGDVDGSGAVDILDALKIAQYYVGLNPVNFNPASADVNCSAAVDIVDALLVAQYYVGLISVFPCLSTPAPTPVPTPTPTSGSGSPDIPWDWAGTIGTGQSLAVGEQGKPVNLVVQPYSNLKLSTGNLAWPVDPANGSLSMVPLTEPAGRLASNYPSSWPTNIAGETPHSAMANQVTTLVRSAFGRDYIGVHGEFGENGQGMIYLKKNASQSGVNGRAFAATLIEIQAIKRLAAAAGKTYGVAAVTVTHGESDSGNTNYENELYQLWRDYNTDIKAITGQSRDLLMIVSQQNSCGDNSASTVAQWKAGVDYPANIVCSGPKYQYPYAADRIHLTTEGYDLCGEKYGQIYYERVVLRNNWQPLQPVNATRNGSVITVQFHVPVLPLRWDTTFQTPHLNESEWRNGKGFEVYAFSSARIPINSVEISGDKVIITCAYDPGANCRVDYAMAANGAPMTTPYTGTVRWGLLRDSDPFVGSTTNKAQPNWCVAFQYRIP